jgi:hypothetical protein
VKKGEREKMSHEARLLLQLTKEAILAKPLDPTLILGEDPPRSITRTKLPTEIRWNQFVTLAAQHAVLPLLYDVLQDREEIPKPIWTQIDQKSTQTVQQFYHLSFLTFYLVHLLENDGLQVAVLKGASIAADYPVPELRKSGDIDLLFPVKKDFLKACERLKQDGFRQETAMHSVYHRSFYSPEGIDVELHYHMVKPFDNAKINHRIDHILERCGNHLIRKNVIGFSLPTLSPSYEAFYLLLHMLHHFLEAGFGIKLLCDWVVFWNASRTSACKEQFLKMTESVKLLGFARMITKVCIMTLGLRAEEVAFLQVEHISQAGAEHFLQEVLEAEEFGKSQTERMVVVRGSSIGAYFKEFHHQMLLNHPKAGRYPLLWLPLWIITLVMFLYRNKKLRKVSTKAILQSAHRRSRLLKEMDLF